MSSNDRTPLSPPASDALEQLCGPIERADGLSRHATVDQLLDAEFGEENAEAVISELLSKGYLYEVDGVLYVTP
jgi:hypothetical protein